MIFRRTRSGLSNFRLFVGSDAVVFLEGGVSFSREEIEKGFFASTSEDIRFWQSLFEIYLPNKNLQFRSIGSKETIKSIALDIETGDVTNVVVAMDRDFDHLLNRKIASKNVLYTYGYSWENDVWNESTLLAAFCSLIGHSKADAADEHNIIKAYLNKFYCKLNRAVKIDALLIQNNDSLFIRSNANFYIAIERNGAPSINCSQLRKSLSDARTRNHRPVVNEFGYETNAFNDCFGHLLASYFYRVLAYLIEKIHKQPKLPKSYANSTAVLMFANLLKSGSFPDISKHYSDEFARVSL